MSYKKAKLLNQFGSLTAKLFIKIKFFIRS